MTKSSTDKETDQGYCKLWKGCGGVEEAEAKEVHWMQSCMAEEPKAGSYRAPDVRGNVIVSHKQCEKWCRFMLRK